MKVFYIDLFSGAGGTTSGIHLVGNPDVEVIACVNHDEKAIESHRANHPNCHHFVEDVRDFEVVKKLARLVRHLRKEHPGCIINIWASLECTNYSKAKGGLPRDADSRTLANALFMYLEELKPEYLFIENVSEFMAWGPLDENGRPISRLNGRDYLKWVRNVQSYGYKFDYKMLNAADFGAFTSRERYFGQFALNGFPICWPEQTHSKTVVKGGLFEPLKQWKAVKEVLDLEDEGESIFTRKKPLVEATLKRIYAGLIKFVAGGEEAFTKVYNSGNDIHRVKSIDEPLGSLTTQNSHAFVNVSRQKESDTDAFLIKYNSMNRNGKYKAPSLNQPAPVISTQGRLAISKVSFLKKYYSGRPKGKVITVEGPAGSITTIDGHAIVNASMLMPYYGGSKGCHSTEKPCPTITTKDRFTKVDAKFFTNSYSGGGQNSSIDKPSPTITGVPKPNLTTARFMDQQFGNSKPKSLKEPNGSITSNPKQNLICVKKPWLMDTNFSNIGSDVNSPSRVITASRKHHYLLNPSWFGHSSSVEKPSPVIVARQDKSPLYLIESEYGQLSIIVYEDDSPMMRKIKEFMALYGIIDIKMRMLKIIELLRIQGFPEDYKLIGTKTEMKKFIGNAVVPVVAKAIAAANYEGLLTQYKQAI